MHQFISALLGGQPAADFFALFFFALIGVVISLLIQTTGRDVWSPATPRVFSWAFFFSDNVRRLVLGFLLIYVALRFCPDLFGAQVSNWMAIVIGICWDKLAQVVKDKTNFLGQKKEA